MASYSAAHYWENLKALAAGSMSSGVRSWVATSWAALAAGVLSDCWRWGSLSKTGTAR